MSKSKYIEMAMRATILREDGDYNRALGEMNPVIFEEFVGMVLDRNLPPVIWEPFASNDPVCRTQSFAEGIDGFELISFSLKPKDPRVKNADSTIESPKGWLLGGVLFHPPYFAAQPFSNDRRDVALMDSKEEYLDAMKKVALHAKLLMEKDALACIVCRAYRSAGERVNLQDWFMEMFESLGFVMEEVWSSEPDIILIMKKGE